MMEALRLAGYEQPSPVQAGVIPLALDQKDVIAQAQTGTGKTAAFAIPILEQVAPISEIPDPQALILAPTRELAVQVRNEFEKLAQGQGVHTVAAYGGKPIKGQIDKIKRGAQVIVGTPGRVLDLIGRGALDTFEIWCVVLDEADRMLDIGFRPDIEKILRNCPKDRQTLLLSATVPPPIEKLANRYMQNPEKLDFSPTEVTVETIDQYYFTVEQRFKYDLLVKLLEREQPKQSIVFVRTKRGVEKLHRKLSKQFKNVACMQGDMQQSARNRVMEQFRADKVQMLVATDVIGRGIDVSGVSHIINYDLPTFSDDYVHRVGRTGRMGKEGVAYSFVLPEEGYELTRIEQRINRQLQRAEIDGFQAIDLTVNEPVDEDAPKPPSLPNRRQRRHRRAL